MLGSLGIHSKKSLFLVHLSALTEGLAFPPDWRTVQTKVNDELLAALETARTEKLRLIVLVSAEHFLAALELFKRRLRDDNSLSYGLVVVAENPPSFLSHRSGFTELLEVLHLSDAQTGLEFHLLRAVRHTRPAARDGRSARRETPRSPRGSAPALAAQGQTFPPPSSARGACRGRPTESTRRGIARRGPSAAPRRPSPSPRSLPILLIG